MKKVDKRIYKDECFMKIVEVASLRSTRIKSIKLEIF